MNKKIISNHQLYALTGSTALGGALLVITAVVASSAKQDAWISTLLAPVYGVPTILIYCFLGSRHPGLTLTGILKSVFGKYFGVLISACYVFAFLSTACHIPWYVGSFTGHVMHETPPYILNLILVAACVIGLIYGIEAIGRVSELFIIFIMLMFVISIVFVLPNAKIEYLQPVLENGLLPPLKGSVFISALVTLPVVSMLTVYPANIKDTKKGGRAIIKGYLWASAIVFIAIIVSIMVLGSAVAARSKYPMLLLAREISIGTVLTRLEYAVSVMWIVSQFLVGMVYFYAGIKMLTELLGFEDYKKFVAPMGLIILVMSGVVLPNTIYQGNYVICGWTPLIFTFGLALPLIMLIVYLIKKWVFKKT